MSSPFRGMNPYLEQPDARHDFHDAFCLAIREAIVPQVRPRYVAKLDEHVFVHELSAEERRFAGRGDVTIAHEPSRPAPPLAGNRTAASAIGMVEHAIDEERLSFIEIRDRSTHELITVIELLSPSNKNNEADRGQYLGKRGSVFAGPAHFVEIDLLRGSRLPIKGLPECDYYVMVSRAEMRPQVELWPFQLRDPLPKIPIPLRAPDPDAVLDLQAVLNRVYDGARYEDYIYSGTSVPPLSSGDQNWAAELLTTIHGPETPRPES